MNTHRHWRLLPLLVMIAVTSRPIEAWSQASGRPVPPGQSAANQATRQAEQVEAPAPVPQKVTPAEVLQQANELLSLAQQVHADAERATQGLVSKDLKDKLKRIEKLSRRLREELGW
jgi:hypothetical protein